tara:strand:- start:4471 stop:4716 length:246 start_codon:yes stop_codon:yes gene_type:complete
LDDQEILGKFSNDSDDSRENQNNEVKDQKNEVMRIKPKKLQKLEKKLITSFLDANDSDYRRRYIKRWIYGEDIKRETNKFV